VRLDTAAGPLWLAGLGDQIAFLPRVAGPAPASTTSPGHWPQIDDDGAPVIMMAHEPDAFVRMPRASH
jgi:predicted MPP superfamily phosphohydrolase